MISMTVELTGGRSIEVASIGTRGRRRRDCQLRPCAGLFARRGAGRRARPFACPMEALEDAKRRSPFIANLFCRFSDYLLPR